MKSEEAKKQLFTGFDIPALPIVDIQSKLFFVGSCFSENISGRLSEMGFACFANPVGIIYNPVSIGKAVEFITSGKKYGPENLYASNGKFHSLDHHGSFQGSNAEKLCERINERISAANTFLKSSDIIFITLGTSYVYYHQQSKVVVANCHKIPAKEFDKILLSENEIIEALVQMENALMSFNPALKICYTISPVKHLRDGVSENALSKARLLSALQLFRASRNHEADYFPAFEIMTEELRDHRFYSDDLAHPSDWSVDYIFDRFVQTRFYPDCIGYTEKIDQYLKMSRHRVMSEDPAEQADWDKKKKDFLSGLRARYPEKNFDFIRG